MHLHSNRALFECKSISSLLKTLHKIHIYHIRKCAKTSIQHSMKLFDGTPPIGGNGEGRGWQRESRGSGGMRVEGRGLGR